jgi:[pyruvate, water dikinase]-phosphate phosphotransferase / [pyruvate, water dikinase] kinase
MQGHRGQGNAPAIMIVSGGTGASGELLARTVIAQFPGVEVSVKVVRSVHDRGQIERICEEAASCGAILVHSLVVGELRTLLAHLAEERGLYAHDIVGDLLAQLSKRIGQSPAGRPGLYRKVREEYFERIDAVEYAVSHDDGRNPQHWLDADILIVGVSRVGKTPLSMYMAMRGWKVANVPFVSGVPLAPELYQVDRRRVVGLTVDPGKLADHRKWRAERLGISQSAYVDLDAIDREIDEATKLFRRNSFIVVDVTDKPIEETGQEIMQRIDSSSVGPASGTRSSWPPAHRP